MAPSRSSRGAPLAAISTKGPRRRRAARPTRVPSSGRARRTVSEAGLIQGEEAFDAFRHVPRRQGGAGYVANVLIELEGIAARLADELREPAAIGDLAAIGFAIFEDLHVPD